MAGGLTVGRAVRRGQMAINLPVSALITGTIGVGALFAPLLKGVAMSLPVVIAILVLFVIASILPAWLYWSVAIPHWKLWAYARVDDLAALKRQARRAGLIWPDGHLFEKTEICSKAMRARILRLEGRI